MLLIQFDVVILHHAYMVHLPGQLLQGRTQEIRKKKDMEHEMLSNPVKGFHGSVSNTDFDVLCVETVFGPLVS